MAPPPSPRDRTRRDVWTSGLLEDWITIMIPRAPFVLLLATLLGGSLLAAAEYRFTLAGQEFDPGILPVMGERKGAMAPGDIGLAAGFRFVLGKPGHYQFRLAGKENTQLLCRLDRGPERCVGIQVVRDGNLIASPAYNPIDKLPLAERKHLRSIRVEDCMLVKDWQKTFQGVDWTQLCLTLDCSGPNRDRPQLPNDLRYLDLPSPSRDLDRSFLKELTELRYFRLVRANDFDLSLLAGATKLRNLDIEGYSVENEETLESLSSLRFLKIRRVGGLKSISFAKGMPHLRVFKIDGTEVQDLRPVERCPDLRLFSATWTSAAHLPDGVKLPLLREIRLLSTPLAQQDDQLALFRKAAPQCTVLTDWHQALVVKLGRIDRLRVRSGGTEYREKEKEKTLFEIREPGEIEALVQLIKLTPQPFRRASFGGSGEPTFEFYRGDKLVAMIGYHHNVGLRWHKGLWPSDASLSKESAQFLAELMADEGVPEPLAKLRDQKARQRHEERYLEAMKEIASEAWLKEAAQAARNIYRGEDFQVGPTLEELTKKTWPDELERASKIFAMYGAVPDGVWSRHLGFDKPLRYTVLGEAMTKIAALLREGKVSPRVMDGITRCYFLHVEEIDEQLTDSDRKKMIERGLAHPRMVNRARTLETLNTDRGEHHLLSFLEKPPLTRPLPEGAIEEPQEVYRKSPFDEEKPVVVTDRELAALLLAQRKCLKARPILKRILRETPKNQKAFYQQALDHLADGR